MTKMSRQHDWKDLVKFFTRKLSHHALNHGLYSDPSTVKATQLPMHTVSSCCSLVQETLVLISYTVYHTDTCMHMNTYIQGHSCTPSHADIHTITHIHAQTCTASHTHAHTTSHARTRCQTCTHPRTPIYMPICAHMRAFRCMGNMYTLSLSHTHTHLILFRLWILVVLLLRGWSYQISAVFSLSLLLPAVVWREYQRTLLEAVDTVFSQKNEVW